MNNFLPLNRQIMNHWLWEEKPFSKGQAWVDLLLLANYEDKKTMYKGEIIVCKRGDVNLSYSYLADRWGWNRKTVKKFLTALEMDKMVTTNVTTHRTTITIVKYEDFNTLGSTKWTTERTTEWTTKSQQGGQQSPITNKDNKVNKGKNIDGLEKYDFEKAWDNTFNIYPKKRDAVSAKTAWMKMLTETLDPVVTAKLIYGALKMYLGNYAKENPDDDDYRYAPTFDKWITNDCEYWIKQYERKKVDSG